MKTIDSLNAGLNRSEWIGQLLIRTTICIVMWPHGAQLLLGLFDGGGFSGTMSYFTEIAGLPWFIGFLVIIIQFFGSISILLGLFTRISALSMGVITIGMIFSGHIEHGFFMNWFGMQKGEGFEFHILLLGLCISLLFYRQYRFSLDQLLRRKIS